MAAICGGSVNHTQYQTIQDSIIQGACGSFSSFPDKGEVVLFQNPNGVAGCASNFFHGIFFGGDQGTVFVPEFMRVCCFVQSVTPTIANSDNNDICLAVNPNDGATVFLLAAAIINTGFITLSVRKTIEVCLPFDQLPCAGGPYVELSSASCGSNPQEPPTNPNCVCPLYVHVNNGAPTNDGFKFPNALAVGNTSSVTAQASFTALQDAEGCCFSAIDLAACLGGAACAPVPENCPSKLAELHGIVQNVNLSIDGLACVTLC